ncbi:hypothetical protein GCM10028805_63090 [Spirosoma harenae]
MLFICLASASAQVKGVVFRDFDQNGVRSDTLPIEVGVRGITVRAFVDINKTPITTTTATDGSYSFNSSDVPAGKPVRLEFSGFLAGDYNGVYGKESGTSIQFVKSPAENVNLGINYPADYCQQVGKKIILPWYVNGNSQITTDKDGNPVPDGDQAALATALVSIPYEASGIAEPNNFMPDRLATANQVGAIWAVAYQRRMKTVFTAAIIKRHASFGPLGTGGIYKTDIATGTTSNFVDLKTIGIDTGTDPHSDLFGDKTQASIDAGPMQAVGRMSIGGMDISEDDRTLYLINLKDRTLYGIFVDSPARTPTAADVKSWAIPDPGCSNGDFRPWAVKVYRGKIYVGVVCTAETSQQQSDLKATIYRIDPTAANPTFEEVLSFPLDFRRGPVDSTFDPLHPEKTCEKYDHWQPWTEAWPEPCGKGNGPTFVMLPQPILSGLSFDDDGSMVIGFMDRFGNLSGVANHDPQGNGDFHGFTAGDLMRAYNNNGTYVLESNGVAGNRAGSGVGNNQGPGGGEFYAKDEWFFIDHIAHFEVTIGGISIIPGYNEVVSSAYDPIANVVQSGGLKVFSNTTGEENRSYVLYTKQPGTFGKAEGVGDTKAICDASPVEIGNRFWFDDNRDGVQDPYEPGIDGITLTLHDMEAGGNQLAAQTTHDGGQFYFNNTTVSGGLKFNHKYQIRMDTAQLSLLDITLDGVKTVSSPQRYYSISPGNRTGFADADLRDSDARMEGNLAVIDVTTSEPGHNDFTNDLAIYSCPQVINEKHSIELCSGSKLDSIVAQSKYFSRVDSVRFVVFSSPQSGTAMYGNGGTVLGTVLPDANNRAVLHNPALTTANNTSGLVNQYVYAIIFPTPENPGCRQTDETVVKISPALSVSALGGGLTCAVKTVTVSSQAFYGNGSTASDAIYSWTGPNGFTSSLQNPTVSEKGSYTVTVNSLNCPGNLTMAVANVTSDISTPSLVAYGNALPCVNCSATLLAEAPGATFFWTGPNNFTSTAAEPEVSIPGEYTVTARGANGCEISETVELLPIQNDPCPVLSVTVTGGELTCALKQLTLTSKVVLSDGSAATDVIYAWTGPGSFTSSLQNPTISAKGSYTLTVSLPNCPDSRTTVVTNVTSDTAVPDLVAYGNAMPCANCSATLLAEAPGATFFWTGPNNFTSTAAEPEVSIPGEYTVTAKGTNGCEISATAELLPIESDPCQPVSVTVTGGKLTCAVKTVTLTSHATFADGSAIPTVIYAWTGPNSFTSALQNPVISTKGSYTLTVSVLDCPDSRTTVVTNVTSDTAVPDLVAYGNAIPCPKCSTTLLAEAPGATFKWTGPKGFTSTEAEPTVTVAGDYTVTATGANGCAISTTVELLPIESDNPCKPVCLPITIKRIR